MTVVYFQAVIEKFADTSTFGESRRLMFQAPLRVEAIFSELISLRSCEHYYHLHRCHLGLAALEDDLNIFGEALTPYSAQRYNPLNILMGVVILTSCSCTVRAFLWHRDRLIIPNISQNDPGIRVI